MASRVLQVVLSLSPGGTERLVIELSRRLHHRHGMSVCCLDDGGAWAQELVDIGVSVTSLGRRGGFTPELGRQIAAIARAEGAEVLHCHHYSPFVYGSIARWWHPLRMVFTEHGRANDGPRSRKRLIANQVLGRLPARIYAVSHDLRGHMLAEGFPPSKVSVIYNGVEPTPIQCEPGNSERKKALGLDSDTLLVGAVGRLDPVKDLDTLLHAFALFAQGRPQARLALIGDGPERDALVGTISALGLGDRVLLTGYRPDVRRLLPALDVYVNTSIFEGVSLTILEAMSAGLPVVATAVGGTPEVVVHDHTGLLVPPRDPHAIADALRQLIDDGDRRRLLGAAGRRRLAERFSIDRMIAEYQNAYDDLEVNACVA